MEFQVEINFSFISDCYTAIVLLTLTNYINLILYYKFDIVRERRAEQIIQKCTLQGN